MPVNFPSYMLSKCRDIMILSGIIISVLKFYLSFQFADYSQYWQSDLFLHLRYETKYIYQSTYPHNLYLLHVCICPCRRLELHYPQFPLEEDFTHRLLGTGDLQQHSEGGELMLLSRFSMEWPILQAGGLLLPKLVEFYQWLHTQLGRRSRE